MKELGTGAVFRVALADTHPCDSSHLTDSDDIAQMNNMHEVRAAGVSMSRLSSGQALAVHPPLGGVNSLGGGHGRSAWAAACRLVDQVAAPALARRAHCWRCWSGGTVSITSTPSPATSSSPSTRTS